MRRVVLLAGIWGWSFLLIKVGLRAFTPAAVSFIRIGLGMVVVLAVLRARGTRLPRDRSSWRHFAVMGLLYSALPFTLLAWSEQHITSSLTAVVNASTPMFVALVAAFSLGERLRVPQLLGLALGLGGVAVAAGVGGDDLASSSLAGVVAALVASASYGLGFVYARRHLPDVAPLVAAGGHLVVGTVLAAPLALATTVADGAQLSLRPVVAVVLLGIFGTGIATALNYRSIAALGPTRASLVTYLVPLVAVTVGVAFLHEPFRARLLVGGALVLVGVGLLQERLARRWLAPVAAALVAVVGLGACGDGGEGGGGGSAGATTTTAAPEAGCGEDVRHPLDPGSAQHLLPGAAEPVYNTDPPTSGAHQPGTEAAGALPAPLSRPEQVAVLEEGGVLIQYGLVGMTDTNRLEALAADDVVVAPNPTLTSPVVATAWRHSLTCLSVDTEALATFIAAHRGRGADGGGDG